MQAQWNGDSDRFHMWELSLINLTPLKKKNDDVTGIFAGREPVA